MKKLFFFFILNLTFTFCCSEEKKIKTPEILTNNLFNARDFKTGDYISGLKIMSVNINSDTGENYNYNASISFKGEVTLTGKFKYYQHDPFLNNNICFYADESSKDKLPRLIQDKRYTWFCFNNQDKAKQDFNIPGSEGNVEIVIDEYKINFGPGETWNTAKLVKILNSL
jgi:hypothetical protein